MTDPRTTRTNAMTVACPFCAAPAGESCTGSRGKLRTSIHAERHIAYIHAQQPRHPADITPWQHPPVYDEPDTAPATMLHPLDEDTRERGLRHLRAIRDQQAEPEPPW